MRNYNNCQMWNIRRATFDDIHIALEHELCCSNKGINYYNIAVIS